MGASGFNGRNPDSGGGEGYYNSASFGPNLVYSPASDTFGVSHSGTPPFSIGFGPETERADNANYLVRAFGIPADGDSMFGLQLLKAGAGSSLSALEYVTLGYLGYYDSIVEEDRRFEFVAGSPTHVNDVPATGTVTYTVRGFVGHGYSYPYYALVGPRENLDATIQVDFAARTVKVTFFAPDTTPPIDRRGFQDFPFEVTAPLVVEDGFVGFQLYQFEPEDYSFRMNGLLYGPDAREIGFGFGGLNGGGSTIGAFAGRR